MSIDNGIALDLSRKHSQHVYGDLTVIMTWYGTNDEEREPCLALVPTHRNALIGRTRPCCIGLSSAYKYANDNFLFEQSGEIAKILGMDGRGDAFKVSRAINDGLLELIKMPPRPPMGNFVAADAFLTDLDTGKTKHLEIHDDV